MGIDFSSVMQAAVECLLFSVIGLVAFILAIVVVERVTPFSLRKEVEEDQNTALGIVLGSIVIGIAIIIAAAISG